MLSVSDRNEIVPVSDSCKGSVREIYVRQIDCTPYLSHLIGYANIFTMFLLVSNVIPIGFFYMKHTN